MEYLVTSQEMKRYDENTIEKIGIPALVLMERAALGICEEVQKACSRLGAKVCILCGTGNNGADGLAAARILCTRGYRVDVVITGDPEKATTQWQQQNRILQNYAVRTGSKIPDQEYDIWIDALFGVGLSREVTGSFRERIEQLNGKKGIKIAVDIPSGVCADDGKILGAAVKADLTVSFGFLKRGLFFYPGCTYVGRVIKKEIGIDAVSFGENLPEMFCYTEKAADLLPERDPGGNKGTFGKVLLAAGSRNMAGAAVLSAGSGYASGAGMVKVITPECNRLILQSTVPEALFTPWEDSPDCVSEADLAWADVLVVGPGLGKKPEAFKILERMLSGSDKPLLIDADGLNLLAERSSLQEMLAMQTQAGRAVVLTPHVMELSRLLKTGVPEIKKEPVAAARKLAGCLGCIVVSKDARTIICGKNGAVCLNKDGNSGMATAGSGDVLAGVLAGLLAQGMDPFKAACIGTYWHAKAGDAAAKTKGERSVSASALIAYLAEACCF